MICSVAGITGADIGKIDLQKKHSLFDVEESKLAKVTQMFRNYNLDGRPVRINRDSDGPSLPKKTAKKEHFKAGKFKRKR